MASPADSRAETGSASPDHAAAPAANDAPSPPPDPAALELAALAAVVAPAEEVVWGREVERRLGIGPTAVFFAAKHIVIDGRWRRGGGLFLFWLGLGLVRRRSWTLALGLHMTANASGVLLGHMTGRDSF